ncbi:nuclear transport factor 2 family protein [Pseudonocardia nigra]|uniref:nuclear transport factor 2 family protein n=1 Tax=Pseudonocardia nigra TaxID=1921578 RepID=UPI001C5CD3DE|nr:nuclear transport factor 2 family protein [Pseudonocardia nigra]
MNRMDTIEEPFEDARRAIGQRLDEILAAVDAGELDRLAGFHLNSPKFTKFNDAAPLERQDFAAAMESEAAEFSALESIRSDIRDLRIDVFGPVAVVTGMYAYQAVADGEALTGEIRASLVMVDDHGEWKIAHEHLSTLT